MNTLLVATDFSAAAENATAYAAGLAQKLAAAVLLLHVYRLPVLVTDYPVPMVTADDVKKVADESLQRAVQKARKDFSGVPFETEIRLGDAATEIEKACEERNPFALVVGTKEQNAFNRFFFGDTAAALMKTCSCPVIAVPEGTTANVPANIVLATDLQNMKDIPAGKITAVAAQLQASLHVVHVEIKTEETISPKLLMSQLSGVRASYHCICEKDVEEGLKQYVQQASIDLVLVLPHKHSLYERLFFRQHTPGIVHAAPVPVMSLRND